MKMDNYITVQRKNSNTLLLHCDFGSGTYMHFQIDEWDIVMLGPQVRHNMKQLTSIGSKTPIAVIEMRDYGLMNGPAALKIIENNPK